jgi:PII-like signaling protein
VSERALKLTMYFGERDRVEGGFLADALFDRYESYGIKTSLLLRGTEGFGVKHHLQTQRLLTLSEDLPLVSIAVDTRERILAAVPEIAAIATHGLLSLERAMLVTRGYDDVDLSPDPFGATKLTIYAGRAETFGPRAAFAAAVAHLRAHGVAGATVLLGVDGTHHGRRRRARFFSRNVDVPLMILAVGSRESVAAAIPGIDAIFHDPIMTVEQVRLCKRDGERLTEPRHMPETDESGLPIWQKLMVHTEAEAHYHGRPLYVELVRRLREAGAAGATVLRGVWGFYGDREPFGDRFFSIKRRVPVHTVIVDSPTNIRRWWEIVDEVTSEHGMVTSELVPASRATGPEVRRGTLRLASISGVLRAMGEHNVR